MKRRFLVINSEMHNIFPCLSLHGGNQSGSRDWRFGSEFAHGGSVPEFGSLRALFTWHVLFRWQGSLPGGKKHTLMRVSWGGSFLWN